MCCGFNSPQIGAPLEKQDLEAMRPETRAFWEEFFGQAEQELNAAEERNDEQPYAPSKEFREKHLRAITEFGGSVYCPVRQLEMIFNFDPPN